MTQSSESINWLKQTTSQNAAQAEQSHAAPQYLHAHGYKMQQQTALFATS